MPEKYTYIADLAAGGKPPQDGIHSRTLFQDDHVKSVIFGFGEDEELSEHTAAMPAILHLISGEATLKLGGDTIEAQAGAWVHMPPHLPHSIVAKTPVTMLLLLLKH